MRVGRKDLLSRLAALQLTCEQRSTIPVLSHVLLQSSGEELTLTTTDLGVWTSVKMASIGGEDEGVSLSTKVAPLVKLLRKMEGAWVDLGGESDELSVRANGSVHVLHGLDASKYPTIPVDNTLANFADVEMSELAEAAKSLLHAAPKHQSSFTISGACLNAGEDHLELAATDGHRLCVARIALSGVTGREAGRLIPLKALRLLASSSLSGEYQISFSPQRTMFSCLDQGWRLISRSPEGTFPDYRKNVFPGFSSIQGGDSHVSVDRRQLIAALDRIIINRDAWLSTSGVILSAKDGLRMTLDRAVETIMTAVSADTGPNKRVAVNPAYLRQCAKSMVSEIVKVKWSGPESPVYILDTSREVAEVLMPIKCEELEEVE